MEKKLLYGTFDTVRPKSEQIKLEEIQIQADGSIDISLSGVKILEIKEETQSITWGDLFHSRLHEFCNEEEIYQETLQDFPFDLAIVNSYIGRLWDDLKKYCHKKSSTEKDFFELYCQLCTYDEGQIAYLPALIPSVHINWECVSKKREKPCIVDFVFKSPKFGTNNLVIVEIDGASHYADYNENGNYYSYYEGKYVESLRKDRWLRKQGFQVLRIGNSEIKEILELPKEKRLKKFYFFFREIFGDIIYNEGWDSF